MTGAKTEINPFDLADLKEKLPALESALETRQAQLFQETEQLQLRQREVKSHEEVVDSLRRILGTYENPPEKLGVKVSNALSAFAAGLVEQQSTKARVVEVVNALGAPVQVDDVLPYLNGANRDTAQWALWKADQDGELKRVAKGVYAPLDGSRGAKEIEGGASAS